MALDEPSSLSDNETVTLSTPSASPKSDATTPVVATARKTTPTDSLVSISLTDRSTTSGESVYTFDTTSKDVVNEVLKRASVVLPSHDSSYGIEDMVDSPGAEERLIEEVAQEKEKTRSRSNSLALNRLSRGRTRSDSVASDSSLQVDWETLDKTEQTQDQESDEQTTLLLARLEQENNAIATNPKSGIKTRARGQSRPPSIMHIQSLVQEQGARAVRFSSLPSAAPMTELDFWAALVRDYPQTAQRLPTVTSNKIRSGIPPPLRGVVWVSMSGARDRAIEEQFDKLLHEPSPYDRIIGKDVGRSFPQHEMFRDPEGEGQRMLGRVLKCYSLYDDKIGYCQGLGFLVGPLLMNMGDKEAFCVLVRLMEDYDLRSCFLPDLSGLHLRIYQFNQLLRQHVPKVAAHLESLGVEGEYLSQWFLSFFAVTCPLPLLFRIYDVIFAEGASETTMRVALSIMQKNEKKILGFSEFEDVMQLLLSRQLWDVYGLNPASADSFVMDFVGLTSLVTRESLNTLEGNFREAQNRAGGRQSFLPNVSHAASRFLGRLWTSTSKQQNLAPGLPNQGHSRSPSTLLRTPSKQSLSTIASIEAPNSDSTVSIASTANTDMSMLSRDSSVDGMSLKSPELMAPRASRHKHNPSTVKERELDGQIEDLLTVLSEMQKNQALLTAQLQRYQEERNEDQIAIRAFLDQIRLDTTPIPRKKVSHRRAASEVGQSQEPDRKLSPTTIRLLDSLETRLASRHSRQSSGYETKADLRHTIATLREQLHVETTRSQEMAREFDVKDQDVNSLREELSKARARIKDAHFDKQRLEKTVMDLRHSQRQNNSNPPSRSNSKGSSSDGGDRLSDLDTRDGSDGGKPGGLREFRLGRGARTNTNGPTQVFAKRTSSLMHAISPPIASTARHVASTSVPVALAPNHHAVHDNDDLMLELASAKTSEAMARQELEELRARFDAMRRQFMSVTPPSASSPSPQYQQNDGLAAAGLDLLSPTRSMSRTPDSATVKSPTPVSASSIGGTALGFFGWGKKS